jgi:hypothetical protein
VKDATTRRVGWSLIALLWVTAVYLIAYYVAVVFVGPERLVRILGEGAYKRLFPWVGFRFSSSWASLQLCGWVLLQLTSSRCGSCCVRR